MREILPDLRVVAIMANVGYSGAVDEMGALVLVPFTPVLIHSYLRTSFK
jgi:hypothetical protein